MGEENARTTSLRGGPTIHFLCYTLPKKSANRSSSEGLFGSCSEDFCGCGGSGSTEAVVAVLEAIFPIT